MLVNNASPIVRNVAELEEDGRQADAKVLIEHVYDLVQLAHGGIDRKRMDLFLERNTVYGNRFNPNYVLEQRR